MNISTAVTLGQGIWKAAAAVRGLVSKVVFRHHVEAMVFLKLAAELHQHSRESYLKKYRGDVERVMRAMRRERFVLPETFDFHKLYTQRYSLDLSNELNQLFTLIRQMNPDLRDVFEPLDFASHEFGDSDQRNEILRRLLEVLITLRLPEQQATIEHPGSAGEIFEHLCRYAGDDDPSELRTPPEVAQLLSELVAPASGERIYDPNCGSGALLMQAARRAASSNIAIYGQESLPAAWSSSRISALLHGFDPSGIERAHAIARPMVDEHDSLKQFDVVLTGPPFGFGQPSVETMAFDRFQRFRRGVPPRHLNDYSLITHIVGVMRPRTGRGAIVAPLGALFRGGAEALIRSRLIDDNLIDGIITLPQRLFSGTSIATAIMLFRAQKPDRNILMIDASRDVIKTKNSHRLDETHIRRIVAAWQERKDVSEYAAVATPAELEANDFNLQPSLYIKSPSLPKTVDLKAVRQRIASLQKQLSVARTELNDALTKLQP